MSKAIQGRSKPVITKIPNRTVVLSDRAAVANLISRVSHAPAKMAVVRRARKSG